MAVSCLLESMGLKWMTTTTVNINTEQQANESPLYTNPERQWIERLVERK